MSDTNRFETVFPARGFRLAIVLVCLVIGLSAVYGYRTVSRLRIQYLERRGEDLASQTDLAVRGPRRRPDPVEWEKELAAIAETNSESVAFLALVDSKTEILAFAGSRRPTGPADWDRLSRDGACHLFSRDVTPSGPNAPGIGRSRDWRLVICLRTEPAGFISRVAVLNLAVAAIAIVSLVGLAVYLERAWTQLLKLRAREEAERHLAALGRMAAGLAHEIRNPLGAIKGLTQIVQEGLPAPDPGREHLSAVLDETSRLENLVRDLLLFARPRPLHPRVIDLAEEAAAVNLLVQADLESRRVLLKVRAENGPVVCRCDPDGLRQVLLNVVRNALEASPEGSAVTLWLSSGKNTAKVVVEDEGPGIAPEIADAVFEPFRTTKISGTGLGLAVSKQIVDRFGGAIVLENRPGRGARCTINLPV